MTNHSQIINLLPPLQNAVALSSWEDAEDLAGELVRLARLKRLEELQTIQEQLAIKQWVKTAPGPIQAPNSPPLTAPEAIVYRPEPEITLETRFDEKGHDEPWRNELARDLNAVLNLAYFHGGALSKPALSVVKRVAEFEKIQILP